MTTDVQITTDDGVRLVGQRRGTKGAPRLALVHSLAMSGAFWDRVVVLLADEFDIVSYDCRGHGASDRAPGPYHIERFGDDLAAVLDGVGWENAIVAGCSMGGCVAQAFAIRHPGRVRALGLIDTTAWYGPDAPAQWRQRGSQGRDQGLASLVAFQTTRWFSDAFRAENPAIVQQLVDVFVANDPDCYAATCDMLGAADLRAGVAALHVPAAVLVGAEDYATPPAMAEALVALLPGAGLTVLPDGRHLTPVQCPDRIATLLRDLAKAAA
jgi:3-oxoadipate enol-lactonase